MAFGLGDAVHHPTYGNGSVVEIGEWNVRRKDYPLWIRFQSGRAQMMYGKVVSSAMGLAPVSDAAPPEISDKELRELPLALIEQLSKSVKRRAIALLQSSDVAPIADEDEHSEAPDDEPIIVNEPPTGVPAEIVKFAPKEKRRLDANTPSWYELKMSGKV